jgi:Domain of unknown function (DUF4159)
VRLRILLIAVILGALSLVIYGQKPFREYPGVEYENFPLPPDYQEKAEFTRARLSYPSVRIGRRRWSSSWTIDYPRSDRHLLAGIRRLTRIHTRSVEQVVQLNDPEDPNDIYNWPFLYAVETGHWDLSDEDCKRLRDYLLRGGFLMTDDFHGTREWEVFMASMQRVFPDRSVVELDNKDAIFHVLYDLDDRFQVPGAQWFQTGRTYEYDGFEARWRGIYDDKGRVMVAICHNMDLGDAWEWSDDPNYPEKWASLAYRIGVNYTIYAMTH